MSKKVLVIDDSPFVFKAVTKALEGTEYEVVGNALDGQLGIDKYIETRADVITLDVTMPVMDGLQTAKKLFETHPEIKNQLWNGHLWNPSYYVGTCGDTTKSVIQMYIETQKVK